MELQQTRELDATAERKLSQYAEVAESGAIVACIYASTRPAIVEQLTRLIEQPNGLPAYIYDRLTRRWEATPDLRFTTPKIHTLKLPQHMESRYYHSLRN